MFKKIIIIGAGIAGLTIGSFLKKRNFNNFRIYEKSEKKENIQSGIQVPPNASRILSFLEPRFFNNNNFIRQDYLKFFSQYSSRMYAKMKISDVVDDKIPYLTCYRSNLLEVFYQFFGTNDIFYKKKAVQIKKDHSYSKVIFDDGSEDFADLVIFADGIFSQFKTKNNLRYSGYIAFRGVIKNFFSENFDSFNSISLWSGKNKHLVSYYLNQDNDISFTGVTKDYENELLKDIAINFTNTFSTEKFKNNFKGENKNLKGITDNVQAVSCWPIYYLKKNIFFEDNHIYIGDSSHGMVPFQAQGAAQAIEDAYILQDEIFKNVTTNLGVFFTKKRSVRVRNVIFRSMMNLYVFHASFFVAKILRNLLIKFLSANFFVKKYYFNKLFNYNPRNTSYYF